MLIKRFAIAASVVWLVTTTAGCANSYKHWAIEQTYGRVPCLTLEPPQIVDAGEYLPLANAPIEAWIVLCNEKIYFCSYRQESAAGGALFFGYVAASMLADEERRCAELEEVPPELQTVIDKRKALPSSDAALPTTNTPKGATSPP